MRIIYGKIGESTQQVGGKHPGTGWVRMLQERPGPLYTAGDDGTWIPEPEPVKLLPQHEFIERFEEHEQQELINNFAPLALKVLAAPSGMVDVTDETAQYARSILESAGWTTERLDQIFAVPE